MPTLPPPASATEALYRAALGRGAHPRYLAAFAVFDEAGVARPWWNPAAALGSLVWLLRWRLWNPALAWLLVVGGALALGWWIQRVWGVWPPGVRGGLLATVALLAAVVPGWWGTAWLHAQVRRRMTEAVRRARTVQEACALLAPAPWAMWPPFLVGPAARKRLLVAGLVFVAVVVGVFVPRAREDAVPPATVSVAVPPPQAAAEPARSEQIDLRPRVRGHGVNVGLFGDPANAERVRERLRAAGLPVVSDVVDSARGALIRVRVGPFDTPGDAERAAEAVRALGLDARVFSP